MMNSEVHMKAIVLILFFLIVPTMAQDVRPLTVVYALDYPPFSWLDEKHPRGVLIDFVDALLTDSLDIPIKHEIYPWARCQLMVSEGTKDMIFTIPTPAREEFCYITKTPVFKSRFVLWTGADNPKLEKIKSITSLEQLIHMDELINAYIIGGGWHSKHLKEVKQKRVYAHSTDILRLLKQHIADVYIEQALLMQYQIKENGFTDDIVMIPNVLDITNWNLMIGKQSPHRDILPRLDSLLQSMEKRGALQALKDSIFSAYQ